MAKLTLNPMFNEIHGTINELTFRRMHGRQTVIKKPDMSSVKWSPAQQAHRERFRQAVIRARSALADPSVRARYEEEAAARGKRAFDLAVSDCYHGREVEKET